MEKQMKNRLVKVLGNTCIQQFGISKVESTADYLLANKVKAFPCDVGDTVYLLNADPRFRAFIEKIEITANGLEFHWVQYDVGVDCAKCWDEGLFTVNDIDKTAFFDETKYLIALKERENNG
jgi:hypothetical protein